VSAAALVEGVRRLGLAVEGSLAELKGGSLVIGLVTSRG
jgi:hypothetical protein